MSTTIRILESAADFHAVEELQRIVWPGSETDIIPLHLLVTAAHNGGLILGAFDEDSLVGFVFGFPGLDQRPDGPHPKHCSHMLGVLPSYRNQGLGFALKRAQWQMVRHQGVDLISWTYDPLLSTNAYLNIAKLGGVSSTYLREVYGEMRDGLNVGLPSDRFQVDLWVHSARVTHRLSKRPRRRLDLAHYFQAGAQVLNPTQVDQHGWPIPPDRERLQDEVDQPGKGEKLELMEIPSDFSNLKQADPSLARAWRLHSRSLFERLFSRGYLVTDFVYLSGSQPRSFYVLSHGNSTLGE